MADSGECPEALSKDVCGLVNHEASAHPILILVTSVIHYRFCLGTGKILHPGCQGTCLESLILIDPKHAFRLRFSPSLFNFIMRDVGLGK